MRGCSLYDYIHFTYNHYKVMTTKEIPQRVKRFRNTRAAASTAGRWETCVYSYWNEKKKQQNRVGHAPDARIRVHMYVLIHGRRKLGAIANNNWLVSAAASVQKHLLFFFLLAFFTLVAHDYKCKDKKKPVCRKILPRRRWRAEQRWRRRCSEKLVKIL